MARNGGDIIVHLERYGGLPYKLVTNRSKLKCDKLGLGMEIEKVRVLMLVHCSWVVDRGIERTLRTSSRWRNPKPLA